MCYGWFAHPLIVGQIIDRFCNMYYQPFYETNPKPPIYTFDSSGSLHLDLEVPDGQYVKVNCDSFYNSNPYVTCPQTGFSEVLYCVSPLHLPNSFYFTNANHDLVPCDLVPFCPKLS